MIRHFKNLSEKSCSGALPGSLVAVIAPTYSVLFQCVLASLYDAIIPSLCLHILHLLLILFGTSMPMYVLQHFLTLGTHAQ